MFNQLIECQLNCNFCYKYQNEYEREIMDFKSFKKILDLLLRLDYNYYFDLTPVLGDPLLDDYLFEKLEYINDKKYTFEFNTNLLEYNKLEESCFLSRCSNNFRLRVSLYDLKQQYINLKRLSETDNKNIDINVIVRIKPHDDMEVFKIKLLFSKFKNFKIIYELDNGNWGGTTKHITTKVLAKKLFCNEGEYPLGICLNGDVISCACCDIKKTTKIGNIFEDVGILECIDFRDNILCNNCMEIIL